MYQYFEKPVTMPGTVHVSSALAVVGNPISSVYPVAFLNCMHEMITLFLDMEAKMDNLGFDLLEVITASTVLETFFVNDSDLFKSSPLQSSWPDGRSGNDEIILAERRYKLGKPGVLPLFLKVSVGIKGTSGTSTSGASISRPVCNISLYSTDNFIGPLASRSLAVNNPPSYSSTAQGAYSSKFVYAFNDDSFTIYPMAHAISGLNANILGRYTGFSTALNWQHGFVIGQASVYVPFSVEEKQMVALLPPQYSGSTDYGSAHLAFGINSVYGYADGALIVTPETSEYRGPAVPPISSGVISGAAPGRKFIAPYTHSLTSGSMVAFDSLVWISDPRRDLLTFSEATFFYAGDYSEVLVMPNLMPTTTDSSSWNSHLGQFAIGLLK